jgi:hypothetical protein
MICTSLTRRRITEGEMRARFQSHTITRRRAGRGTAKLQRKTRQSWLRAERLLALHLEPNVGLIMPAKAFRLGALLRCCGAVVMRS